MRLTNCRRKNAYPRPCTILGSLGGDGGSRNDGNSFGLRGCRCDDGFGHRDALLFVLVPTRTTPLSSTVLRGTTIGKDFGRNGV